MGVFKDVGRLMKAANKHPRPKLGESLKEAADLAEYWSEQTPQSMEAAYGVATGNPYANLQFYSSGTPAAGTVVSLEPTGADLEGTPIYRVELDVRIDGQEAYRSSYQTVIAASALTNWQPGKVLPFRVSPEDPHALMLG